MVQISRFWKTFRRDKAGLLGISIIGFFSLLALFAPLASPYAPDATNPNLSFYAPALSHLLGTDGLGQDVLSRAIYGARVSLIVGFSASGIIVGIGVMVGLSSGFYGGIIDEVLMRLTDFFLVVPSLVLMIIVAAMLGPSLFNVIAIISLLSWPSTARVVRSMVISLKEWPFVEAAKSSGGGDLYIMLHHLLPNALPVVFATGVLSISGAIFSQAALVFLGVGNVTDISWGSMLHDALEFGAISAGYWWVVVPPGICLVLLILGFILLGHSLEEIFNPRLRSV